MQRLLPLLPLQESPRRKHIRFTKLIQGGGGASFPALVQVVRAQSAMKVGILAAGGIAGTMAKTLNNLHHPEVELYAVASRSQERADAFAREYNVPVAYGSYEALAADPQVDLIYIASPHSEHYAHAKLCLEHKKAILVEKAFTANAAQAQEILDLGKSQNTLVTEAIWTRYMPSRAIISHALKEGKIGTPYSIQANLGYPVSHKDRIFKPELAGGALLDIGVYALSLTRSFMQSKPTKILSQMLPAPTGVDEQATILLMNEDNQMATIALSLHSKQPKRAMISCEKAYIEIMEFPRANKAVITDAVTGEKQEIIVGDTKKALQYEMEDMEKAILEEETDLLQFTYTQDVMDIMTKLRREWNLVYPEEM